MTSLVYGPMISTKRQAMALHRRRLLQFAAGAAAVPALARTASAQAYPSRPITMVVPLPPGGAYDLLARLLAEPMRAFLGQPALVENIPGADRGIIKVVRAAADGYTLGIGGWNTYVLRPAVFPMQHDLIKELEPIAFLADAPYWIISKNALPAKDLKELIAWLKANPGKASAGTTGAGGGSHVCGVSSTPMPAPRGSRRTGPHRARASAARPRIPPRSSARSVPDGGGPWRR